MFLVPDTRDPEKCIGGTIHVEAVLDERGFNAIVEFEEPPDRVALERGRYRLYFMYSTMGTMYGQTKCEEFTSAHPKGFGFEVDGRNNYVASITRKGLAIAPIKVRSREWKQ